MFLGQHLPVDTLQQVLAGHWEGKMEQTQVGLSDATCYESYIRYPTDVKLLWECCEWLWDWICKICKSIGQQRPRAKVKEQQQRYLNYQKKRRKTYKEGRKRCKSLLGLLKQLRGHMTKVLGAWTASDKWDKIGLGARFFERLGTIKKVYTQQRFHYDRPGEPVPHRIVSLAKPYVRPIVRGKETKRVEFGMKVNVLQVNDINFLEYADFEAFHEGVRLKNTVWAHRRYFSKISQFAGDAIYATNANRRYCSEQEIFTGFMRKGRAGKDEAQASKMRKELQRARATRMEGSFENEKKSLYGGPCQGQDGAYRKSLDILWHPDGQCAKMVKKWPKAPP